MTIANSVAAKLSVAFVAIAMMFSLVAPAQAQTVEELQAEIAALMAQINGLQADMGGDTMSSSSVCPYTWTRSLSMGDTGMDVMKLQQFLNADAATQVAATGAGSAGNETEYYGPATGAAVAKFQEMYREDILSPLGLVNSTTFFGPSTMAKANALCVGGDMMEEEEGEEGEMEEGEMEEEESAGSGSLGNDEGEIESIDEVSADDSSAEEGTLSALFAFEVEVEGDVEIDRVDLYLGNLAGGTQSDDADDYYEAASLWVDGDKVAELDVDEFDEDDYTVIADAGNWAPGEEYRLRFSNLGLVFEDGDEPEFVLGLEVADNIDSDDLTETWGVQMEDNEGIRFVDGAGFTDTEGENIFETWGFDEEETAELDISEASDNPDPTTLKIEEDDDESDEYVVFIFEIEEENGVDVTIEDMRVTVTTTGSTTESDVVDEAILYQGSTELASENVPDGGVVDFENLGVEIEGDATEEFSVALVFNGEDDHGNSSAVTVDFTSIRDAEDARGNDEGEMTISGTATSEEHQLRTVVPVISDTSFDNDRAEDGDAGTISFEFTIEADDDDYDFGIADKADVDGSTDDIRFTIQGTDLTIATSSISLTSGDATSTGAGWTIQDGDEATFIMDVNFTTVDAGDNGTYRVTVDTVGGIEIDETSNGMNLTF